MHVAQRAGMLCVRVLAACGQAAQSKLDDFWDSFSTVALLFE